MRRSDRHCMVHASNLGILTVMMSEFLQEERRLYPSKQSIEGESL